MLVCCDPGPNIQYYAFIHSIFQVRSGNFTADYFFMQIQCFLDDFIENFKILQKTRQLTNYLQKSKKIRFFLEIENTVVII